MKREEYQVQILQIDTSHDKRISSGIYYSFIFILTGTCQFSEKNILHRCGFEDLIILKPGQTALLHKTSVNHPLVLMAVHYSPELLSALSDAQTNLITSIEVVPFSVTSVHGTTETFMLPKNLCRRLLTVKKEASDFANPIFEKSVLSMLLVLILRACIQFEFKQKGGTKKHFILDDLFLYLHTHLTEEITLDTLEQTFYVSKYHILREFKKQTGQTVHSYLIKLKLDLCKKYIEEGRPITEVYKLGGFGGYNHFFRAFKKEYGMTPKEYYHRFCSTIPEA